MTSKNPEFPILEKALANEIDYFISMSDADFESYVANSRIKQRVKSIGKYEVHIYSRDHNPPHFHVISKDGSLDAKFRIDDGSLLSQYGDLRSGILKRINLWFNDIKTQAILNTIWNKRNRYL
jgi:hypothetical protein